MKARIIRDGEAHGSRGDTLAEIDGVRFTLQVHGWYWVALTPFHRATPAETDALDRALCDHRGL